MTGNVINDSQRNFGVYGNQIEQFRHNIDTTNLINGKPIYYLVGVTDPVVTSTENPGFIGLVECANPSINGVSISNNFQGILLARTTGSFIGSIEGCTFSNNNEGAYLWESTSNWIGNSLIENNRNGVLITSNNVVDSENTVIYSTIQNNVENGVKIINASRNYVDTCTILNNGEAGVKVIDSRNNGINYNQIENNPYGIIITSEVASNDLNYIKGNNINYNTQDGILINNSNENTIENNFITYSGNSGIRIVGSTGNHVKNANNLENNAIGIVVDSSGNSIYWNNFDNNGQHVIDTGTNSYDYSGKGNYWSGYTTDENEDGILDPREINSSSTDHYPQSVKCEYQGGGDA